MAPIIALTAVPMAALLGLLRLVAVAHRALVIDLHRLTVHRAHRLDEARELIGAAVVNAYVVEVERHLGAARDAPATRDVRHMPLDDRAAELVGRVHGHGEAVAHSRRLR